MMAMTLFALRHGLAAPVQEPDGSISLAVPQEKTLAMSINLTMVSAPDDTAEIVQAMLAHLEPQMKPARGK